MESIPLVRSTAWNPLSGAYPLILRHAHGSQGRHPPLSLRQPPTRSPMDFTPRMPSSSTVLFSALQTEEHSTLPTFNSFSPSARLACTDIAPWMTFHTVLLLNIAQYCPVMFPSSHVIALSLLFHFYLGVPFWSPCTMLFYLSGLYPYVAFLTFQCVL